MSSAAPGPSRPNKHETPDSASEEALPLERLDHFKICTICKASYNPKWYENKYSSQAYTIEELKPFVPLGIAELCNYYVVPNYLYEGVGAKLEDTFCVPCFRHLADIGIMTPESCWDTDGVAVTKKDKDLKITRNKKCKGLVLCMVHVKNKRRVSEKEVENYKDPDADTKLGKFRISLVKAHLERWGPPEIATETPFVDLGSDSEESDSDDESVISSDNEELYEQESDAVPPKIPKLDSNL